MIADTYPPAPRNAGQLMVAARRCTGAGTDFCHFNTISITVRVRQASWNVMKPRIQCVLAQ